MLRRRYKWKPFAANGAPNPAMKRINRPILIVFALLVVAIVAIRWRTISNVREWCNAVPTGATRVEVIVMAGDANLELPSDTNGKVFGVHRRLLPIGFSICTVTFDGDVVLSTRYETS